ncbi:MAG: BON domain-containing protein [Planctomycetes bacterium]|nr:BON domain-containing protein [Planctomycetota bacterium]
MRRFFVTLALIAIALAPFGARANDRQIAEQIVRSLKQRKAAGELQGFNIDLQVDKGAVWLKGHVSEPEQERIALDIARRVEGVEKVFNQIEVRAEDSSESEAVASSSRRSVNQAQLLGTAPTQAVQPQQTTTQLASSEEALDNGQEVSRRIAQTLVTKLRDEQKAGNLKRFGIDIQVDKGTLWLKGNLDSESQRHIVLEIARRIPGVKQVVNELSIETVEIVAEPTPAVEPEVHLAPTTSRRQAEVEPIATAEPEPIAEPVAKQSDSEQITDEVLSRLATQKKLGALREFGIDVQVDKGVVWMSGYVADSEQRTLALDMARFVPGVKQVVNDLTITAAAEETVAQFVANPVPADPSVPVEPQGLQPLRPAFAPQIAAQPALQAAPTPQAQPASQLPNGLSYLPVGQQSQVAGWALVNVGGNQPQAQQYVRPVSNQMPMAFAPARPVNYTQMQAGGQPVPMMGGHGVGVAPARYDHPQLPGYAWPSYAAHPNYGAVTYPKQYSAQAWPYIGPFYPYPQVPLGWRKVTLEWDDGWWQLDFKDR